jgi:hypothetical protein
MLLKSLISLYRDVGTGIEGWSGYMMAGLEWSYIFEQGNEPKF